MSEQKKLRRKHPERARRALARRASEGAASVLKDPGEPWLNLSFNFNSNNYIGAFFTCDAAYLYVYWVQCLWGGRTNLYIYLVLDTKTMCQSLKIVRMFSKTPSLKRQRCCFLDGGEIQKLIAADKSFLSVKLWSRFEMAFTSKDIIARISST